jgi:hypothetical protein
MKTEEYNAMMSSDKCQRTIHMSNDFGKAGTRKCGKTATQKQGDGLPVCEYHFQKWIKKQPKQADNKCNHDLKFRYVDGHKLCEECGLEFGF